MTLQSTQRELTLGRTTIVAVMAALMTFAKQLAFLLVEDNRYFLLWRRSDTVAVLLDISIFATVLFGVAVVARRWSLTERIWNRVLMLLLVSGALTLLPVWLLPPMSLNAYRLGAMAIAAAVISLIWPRFRLIKYVSDGCVILSPLLPILFFQLLTANAWSANQESGPPGTRHEFRPQQASSGRAPIMIFVFDEWSSKRTAVDGTFLAQYPNSARIAADSMVFRNAWSFSTHSHQSLPALIFQNDQRIQIKPGMTDWDEHGRAMPSTQVPSLFEAARRAGYHTALEGFYLPYQRILGDQIEYGRSWPTEPRGDSFLDSMKISAWRNLIWVVDPWTRRARGTLQARIQSDWWYAMVHRMQDEALQLIDECPPNTLAIFHWPLPHGPFVLNEDGSYYGQYPSGNLLDGLHGPQAQVEDYERHLKYHDQVLGEIVSHLKAANKYDEALLVFTSDHSWRSDPIETHPNWKIDPSRRRVPLLVKLPGQRTSHMIDKTVYNNLHLQPIVEAVLRGQAISDEAGLSLINQMEDVATPTGPNSVRARTYEDARSIPTHSDRQ